MGVGWLMVRVGRMCGGSGKFFKDFHLPFLGSGDRFLVEFFVFRLCRSALEGVSCPCGSVCGLVEVWCWVAVFFVFLGRNRKKFFPRSLRMQVFAYFACFACFAYFQVFASQNFVSDVVQVY